MEETGGSSVDLGAEVVSTVSGYQGDVVAVGVAVLSIIGLIAGFRWVRRALAG